MLGIFKGNKRKQQEDNMRVIRERRSQRQAQVYKAVLELNRTYRRPVTGREIAQQARLDSASVTNRLAEMVKKGRLEVPYRKKGLDGMWRNYYQVVQ